MSRIINFARLQAGEPYVFGAAGMNTWDCSGLTKTAVKQIGLTFFHGASTQWHRGCGVMDAAARGHPEWVGYFGEWGTIDTIPLNKVCQLFNQDKSKDKIVMSHTGLYDGRGNVIQAGGQFKGVSDKRLYKDRWSHWGKLNDYWKGRDDSMDLKNGNEGSDVKILQQGLVRLDYSLVIDGKFGPKTEAAVKAFQKDNGLSVTGIWTTENQKVLLVRLGIIDGPEPIDAVALWNELEAHATRDTEIRKILRG